MSTSHVQILPEQIQETDSGTTDLNHSLVFNLPSSDMQLCVKVLLMSLPCCRRNLQTWPQEVKRGVQE